MSFTHASVTRFSMEKTSPASNSSFPPPPPHQYPVNNKTAPTKEESLWLTTVQTKLKLSQALVPSILACIVTQAVAAFFLSTAALTFNGAIINARDFSDDKTHDGNVLFIVFSVFSGLASAMCAPLAQTSGYAVIILSGVILMMFSTVTSSVVTSAETLVIPFSVFGACAYGLLNTGPQIAMLDFLNDKRSLATGLSYLGVTTGQLVALIAFSFSDMVDDAKYSGSGLARWPNNLRVIDVTAVFALFAASVIKKPSFTTDRWPNLFFNLPFYLLCLINFLVSMGFTMLNLIYSELPTERDFETHPEGSHEIFSVSFIAQMVEFLTVVLVLVINGVFIQKSIGTIDKLVLLVSGSLVAFLALLSYINEPSYKDFHAFAFYGSIAGLVKAVVRMSLPIAMITYVGRVDYKFGLPFLELAGGLGDLVSNIIQEETDMPKEEPLETGWYIAATVFVVVSALSIYAHFSFTVYNEQSEDAGGTEKGAEGEENVEALENATFTSDDPQVEVIDLATSSP